MPDLTPVFVLSMPRSGSTLVQRVLGAHPQVATVAEPWLLLPLAYTLRDEGLFAEYNHQLYRKALADFCAALPEGEADYRAALRSMVLDLYRRAAGDEATHFVDKTPRYMLIADELMRIFPEARFVVLWRNPLAVLASIIETWGGGRWITHVFKVDLFAGLARLIEAVEHAPVPVHAVRYEDLVGGDAQPWHAVFEAAGLSFDPGLLSDFQSTDVSGFMGDRWGSKKYDALSGGSVDKWKATLANPLRKAWARRYLQWLGAERLAAMGYDLNELLDQLASVPMTTRHLASDALHMSKGVIQPWVEPGIVRAKRRRLHRRDEVVVHT